MAYLISDDCLMCGACQLECPNMAITEGENKYVINPEKCSECGACSQVCPVGAPQPAK